MCTIIITLLYLLVPLSTTHLCDAFHTRLCHHVLETVNHPIISSKIINARTSDSTTLCPKGFDPEHCDNVSQSVMAVHQAGVCVQPTILYTRQLACTVCTGLFKVAVNIYKQPQVSNHLF